MIEAGSNLGLLQTSGRFLHTRIRGWRMVGMVSALTLMLGVGWLLNQPSILLGTIVDKVTEGDSKTFVDVVPILLLIAATIVGAELLTIARKLIVERIATNVESEEFVGVTRHILSMDLAWLNAERIGALNVRVHRSIEGVTKLLKVCFLDFMPTVAIAVVGLLLAAQRSGYVAGIMVVVTVFGLAITIAQVASQKGIRIGLFRAKEDLSANMAELLSGIEYVRASGMINVETGRAGSLAARLRDREYLHHKWMASFDASKQLVEGLGWIGVIGLSAWFASTSVVSKGDVLTLAMLYVSVSRPLRDLHRTIDEGFEAILKVGDLAGIYERPRDAGLAGTALPFVREAGPLISCRDLVVEYRNPDGSMYPALNGIKFEMFPGEIVGIAGASGSGKSTLIKVLLGLVPNYRGCAQLFGGEVRELDKAKLAQLVAYVPQTPFLIKGSVRDNVTYSSGADAWSAEAVMSALSCAQMGPKIDLLPSGLDSQVEEHGRNFSGGERQRLGLARLFLMNHELVLLDEPTAALDTLSERLVQQSMSELLRGKSALVIAHRLDTLRSATRIVVFDRGLIVQSGIFDELVQCAGAFRDLVQKERQSAEIVGGSSSAPSGTDPILALLN
jgi:ATP-binding cassette subfamily B protein